jgi:non-canonical poly(A) RNA polymerase PAPD5/7
LLDMDFISLLPESDKEVQNASGDRDPCAKAAKRFTTADKNVARKPLYRTFAPWFDVSKRYSAIPVLKLHEEITDFVSFIKPTNEEHAARISAVSRLRNLALKIFGERIKSVDVFGSFETGLYLPSSDLDVVVIFSNHGESVRDAVSKPPIKKLARAIVVNGLADKDNCKTILKARVPIIKYTDKITNYSIDVAFNIDTGTEGIQYIKALLKEFKALRPLTLVLKQFLEQRALNEPYTGGLGSYSLVCMLASFFQMHPLIQSKLIDPCENFGILLMDFLELYGKAFNSDNAGISVMKSEYFDKVERGWRIDRRSSQLSIEDPQNEENDLCRATYCFHTVRQSFEHAYMLLVGILKNKPPQRDNILASVVGVSDDILRHRCYIEQISKK